MLLLHNEQTEARSLLEEALWECRDQRDAMFDFSQELASLTIAV